jgi:hypothetical protein
VLNDLQFFAAGFGATLALVGATLAVIHFVLAAFFGAQAAGFFAYRQKRLEQFGVAQPEPHGLGTKLGAVAVELDAAGHHRHIIFVETGSRTCFTGHYTVQQLAHQLITLMSGTERRSFLMFFHKEKVLLS